MCLSVVQKLHGDERPSVLLADVVNRADIGMTEGGCCTRFAAEPFQGLLVMRHFRGQKLQSYEAAEASVLGLVHHPHAAAAELLDDAVMRDGLADHECSGEMSAVMVGRHSI